MFCAGITQFACKNYCWEFEATRNEVLIANIYIIIFILVFAISRIKIFPQKVVGTKNITLDGKSQIVCRDGLLFGIEFFMLATGGYAIAKNGFSILFSRELFGSNSFSSLISNSALRQVVSAIINATCMFCVVLSLNNIKKRRTAKGVLFLIVALIDLLINVPPLAVPRFAFAGIYGGIFLYFSKRLKKGRKFAYILFFGLLVVFPALNAFRYISNGLDLKRINESFGEITNNFTRADYDSYTMLLYSIRYIRTYGITYGKQLLGAILFFIPRTLWSQKPGGSGALIIECLAPSYINPNVSCPIIGEGLINFGFVGVLLFSFVIGKCSKAMDDLYWNKTKKTSDCYNCIYSYITLFSLFMFRGDLMSSIAFLMGMVMITIFLSVLFRKKTRNEKFKSLDIKNGK